MNLIDTNVLSEVRHPRGDPRVKAAFLALGDDLRLSVVVLGEIRFGIALERELRRQSDLARWYGGLLAAYGRVVLPVGREIAERWGDIAAGLRAAGRAIDAPDGLIAATALHHDLTLWTRNTRDFDGTGVRLFNPWED
jgi:predicted nucleic acid-binding protein